MKKIKIRKDDYVMVIAGVDKGNEGRVMAVDRKKGRVLVEGINKHVKHERPSQNNQQGGRIEQEFPIHISNVMLLDSDKNPTRVRLEKQEQGKRTVIKRISVKNNQEI